MIERVECRIWDGREGLAGALGRYELVERVAKATRRQAVGLLAFGIGRAEIRLVLDGRGAAVGNVLRGVKVGTTRAARRYGVRLTWSTNDRRPVEAGALEEAVAWAHRAPVDAGLPDPLASPWSSHRDLLGYRDARFYDPRPAREAVDPARVHLLAGGRALPKGWPPRRARQEPLELLLRIAAGVSGVLPADTRCFGLFVSLARARGWQSGEIAPVLAVTPRRVRQLGQEEDPRVTVALRCLADPRLSRVP